MRMRPIVELDKYFSSFEHLKPISRFTTLPPVIFTRLNYKRVRDNPFHMDKTQCSRRRVLLRGVERMNGFGKKAGLNPEGEE
jgi:hypothetical protein